MTHHYANSGATTMFDDTIDPQAMIEEILAMTEEEKETELRRAGISRAPAADVYAEAARRYAPEAEEAVSVPRPAMVDRLTDLLTTHRAVVLAGAAGCGKTWLLNQVVGRLALTEPVTPLMLDAQALRPGSPTLLAREALMLLNAITADATNEFDAARRRHAAASPADGDALTRFLVDPKRPRPILAVDHADALAEDRGSVLWLKALKVAVAGNGGAMIVACRAAPFGGRRGRLPKGGYRSRANELATTLEAPTFFCDDLSSQELRHWVAARDIGIDLQAVAAKNVHRILGGRPRLVAGLCRYARARRSKVINAALLREYAATAANQYSVECAALLDVARAHPALLTDPTRASAGLHLQLIETGAMRHRSDGRLIFSSPVIARRYETLTAQHHLLWMAASGPGLLAADRPAEIAGIGLRQWLRELAPSEALTVLPRWAEQRGFGAVELFLADRENAHLWSQFWPKRKRSGPVPLAYEGGRAFAESVAQVRAKLDASGRAFLPMLGTTGRVELVLSGYPGCERAARASVEETFGLLSTVQPSLAATLETASLRRKDKLQRSLYHRLLTTGTGHINPVVNAAQAANCSAFAVLERGLDAWVIGSVETVQARDPMPMGGDAKADPPVDWEEWLDLPRTSVLNEIARHPSRRGLVLTGSDLLAAFPRMRHAGGNVAAYVHPVWQGSRCRLVTFLFRNAASRSISGLTQVELANLAPLAVPGAAMAG